MEQVQEEVSINSNNNHNKLDQQSHIIKRKRTKRQRPQSPIPFLHNPNDKNLSQAAASSAEEDELDMVNCLIMLSKCQSRKSPKQAHYDHLQEIAQIDQLHNHNTKFISRKFLEIPSSGFDSDSDSNSGTCNGGYYVYECKTCYKMFPSFQALGGHRASHKKPNKSMAMNDEEDGNIRKVSSLSFQLSNNYNNDNSRGGNRNLYSPSSSNKMKSSRVHECSICGAKFTSGQALGGHMRRHRTAEPVKAAAAAATMIDRTLSLSPMEVEVKEPRKSRNNMLYLDLDLNLPAPEDDMIKESKLPFSPKQQKQQQQQKSCLVFSAAAPTLVDCHY